MFALAKSKRPDVLMLGLRGISGAQGGVETHVRNLTHHLARHSVSVEVVARSPYEEPGKGSTDERVSVTRIWSPRSVSAEAIVHSFLGVLYAAVRRPRIVHIHAIGPALMTPLARLFGLRVVVTHHGQDYKREKWGRLARLALRLGEIAMAYTANARIVVAPDLARRLSQAYKREFNYIPNGVNLTPAQPSSSILEAFGLAPRRYILSVGRLVPEKRHADLVRAFAALDDPGLKLVIAGAADHASDYEKSLRALAANHPDVILAGFQAAAPLAELFANAALFALPSSHEGLPISLLEAMSHGLPIVASDIQANLDVGLPADCYVRTGSIEALTEGLRRQLSAAAHQAARVDWRQHLEPFRWPKIVDRTLSVYAGVSGTIARSRQG